MLLRRINLPSILLSYHSFLHFSVNFLSHSHLAVFDIKIVRKQVLVLILSHNLSHKLPRQPPLSLITRAFFASGNLSIGKLSTFGEQEFVAQIGVCIGKPAESVSHKGLCCDLCNAALHTAGIERSSQIVQLVVR